MDKTDEQLVQRLLQHLDYHMSISVDHVQVQQCLEKLHVIRDKYRRLQGDDDDDVSTQYAPYPELDDAKFNERLLSKREFNRYARRDHEFSRCGGDDDDDVYALSSVQKFLKSFMHPNTPYRSLLLYHSVGVGKTLSALVIAEQFRRVTKQKVIVLMPSNLQQNFRRQIFDINNLKNPVSRKYYNEVRNSALDDAVINRRAHRLIDDRYTFFGFMEFYNHVQSMLQDKAMEDSIILRDAFSDCVIIIDEVHNVRITDEVEAKLVPPILKRVLECALNTRLIMLTATPMFDSATEIVWLVNLMLANDKRGTLDEDKIFNKNGHFIDDNAKHTLMRHLVGYVSYQAAFNPYTYPVRLRPSDHSKQGVVVRPRLNWDGELINSQERVELYSSLMGSAQQQAYHLVESQMNDNNIKRSILRELSNICYPLFEEKDVRQAAGKLGFYNHFTRNDSGAYQYKDASKRLCKGMFLSGHILRAHSPKIAAIVENATRCKGLAFVYTFFIHSGVYPMAIALEHVGFSRFKQPNLCRDTEHSNKAGGLTYAIISTDKELVSNVDEVVRVFSSPENRDGSLIKVLVGSSIAAEGFDFKHIREVHFLEPWFHVNKMEQVVGRAIRNCSHQLLKPEHRNVTVYNHSIRRSDSVNRMETADERHYRIAEEKQAAIERVQDMLKAAAVDCRLNLNVHNHDPIVFKLETSQGRLIKKTITSPAHPPCMQEKSSSSKKDDTSTFGTHFLEAEIQDCMHRIKAYISKSSGVFTYNELQEHAADDVLCHTLQQMLQQRTQVVNSRGVTGYIIYASDKYMFQPHGISEVVLGVREREHYEPRMNKRLVFKAKHHQSTSRVDVHHMVEDVYQGLESVLKGRDRYEPAMYDYVIDRLGSRELLQLCVEMLRAPDERILRSLKDGFMVLCDAATGRVTHVQDVFENKIYIVHGGALEEASTAEQGNVRELVSKMMASRRRGDVRGFLDDDHKFKLFGQSKHSTKGTACSTAKHENLSALLEEAKGRGLRLKKDVLCMLLEIVYRSNNQFARRFEKATNLKK